jgi:methylsterol monooxygenase/4-alpha-methyl-delta7-sterol-4alpha-methyl oxidase
MLIIEDFLFHSVHRLMHSKYLYARFHKIHHQYNSSIGLASEYSHPLDFALGVLIPTGTGARILGKRFHYFTFILFAIMRSAEGVDGHTGYEFPWSPFRLLPFSASTKYHDFHHTHNVGNYSSFFIVWDILFGTNKAYN